MKLERYKVKVAVYLILIREGKILLQLRQGTDYMCNTWGVPSGHIELGEGCIEALIREVREETGLEFKPCDLIFSMAQHRIESGYLCLYFTVQPTVQLAKPRIMEPNKCGGLEFFDLNNLPTPLVPELNDYLLAKVGGYNYIDTHR